MVDTGVSSKLSPAKKLSSLNTRTLAAAQRNRERCHRCGGEFCLGGQMKNGRLTVLILLTINGPMYVVYL